MWAIPYPTQGIPDSSLFTRIPRMNITVRLMSESDLPAVLSIQAACYPQHYQEEASAFKAKLRLNPCGCWVACRDQHVQGYLVTVLTDEHHIPSLNSDSLWEPVYPHMLFIHDLALNPEARGLGLSNAMLDSALDYARCRALSTIALVAVQGADAYWTKQGFQARTPSHPVMQQRLASFGPDALFMMRAP